MKLIRQMCHGALRTPDVERSRWHAVEVLGLRESERRDDTVYLTCGPTHHDLELIASDAAALDHFSLEASSEEALETLLDRLGEEGAELLPEPDEPGLARAIRFVAPDGHVIEVHAGMAQGQPAHYNGPGIQPRKFGHVTVGSPDRAGLESFLERVLGFIPSDRVGDEIVWMRCNADHHGIAIIQAEEPSLRHLAWELDSFADLGIVADHLQHNGIPLIWGPGRHGPGNNIAMYHADPAGALHEHLADLEQIHDDRWRGRDWNRVWNWRNLWGFGTEAAGAPPSGRFPPVARRVCADS